MEVILLKKYLRIIIVLAVIMSIIGCAQNTDNNNMEQSNEEELIYGITTDPDHLDPFLATSADSRVVLFNIFEGLLKLSSDGTMVPAIAESYEVSDDLMKYTFSLQDDVKFHNGKTVTADDVKYSLDKAVEYQLTGMEEVENISIIDESTIQINLNQPDSEFYYNMTTAIIPENYEDSNSRPIGTGPFKFESYSPQEELVLTKFVDYRNPELPKVDKLTFKIVADLNTVLFDLQAGSVNASTLDTTLASQLDSNDFNIYYTNTNAVQIFCLNNSVEPLNNVLVRQAISYVVDANEIIDIAHNGHAERAASPVIPALKDGYNVALNDTYKKDVEKAKQLLDEAGYPDGFTLSITVPSSYKQHVDTAQVIVNQLGEIGISATIEQVDWSTWLSEVYKGRNYQTTVVSVDGITLSPRSYLSRYTKGNSLNFINYSNDKYNELYQQSLVEADSEKRTELYHEMQKIISEDAASVFICDISAPKVFKKGIEGFVPYPLYILDASTIYFE